MWHCDICNKPFTRELTQKRHVPYCRRNQLRPRKRQRSCRSCGAAKVKCTFQAPCRRCEAKGLDCVYEPATTGVSAAEEAEQGPRSTVGQPATDPPDLTTAAVQDDGIEDIDGAIADDTQTMGAPPHSRDTSRTNGSLGNLPSLEANTPMASWYDETFGPSISGTASLSNTLDQFGVWDMPYSLIQPRFWDAAQTPWSTWTTTATNETASSVSNLDVGLCISQPSCLVANRPPSTAAQHNINLVLQVLRSYPLMMLRRETFPPFIHPHWHRQCTPALPEALSNCMSISHMYAFRSDETKPFLWRTMKAENDRVLTQCPKFSQEDLIASMQAQIIYMIMRFVDAGSQPSGLNQQLVITYQVLYKQFLRTKGCPSLISEADEFSLRPSWESWIFEESTRRVGCLYFLICRCLSLDTGVDQCNVANVFSELPLTSPKTLWEVKTRAEWESEYSAYSIARETALRTVGMLIEAHRHSEDPAMSQLLDYWNGRADNLGSLLNIAARMVIET